MISNSDLTANTLNPNATTQGVPKTFRPIRATFPPSASPPVGTPITVVEGQLPPSATLYVVNDVNVTGEIYDQTLTLGWQGQLGLNRGGTGSNLSSTGGPSQVLMQTSNGAPISVAQLAAANLANGTTGSGTLVLSVSPTITTPTITTSITTPVAILTGGTPTTSSGQIGLGTTTGIGNGGAANIQAPAKGSGTGPATPTTVVDWLEIDKAGSKFWIPMCQ